MEQKIILETERLFLREMNTDDFLKLIVWNESIKAVFGSSDPKIFFDFPEWERVFEVWESLDCFIKVMHHPIELHKPRNNPYNSDFPVIVNYDSVDWYQIRFTIENVFQKFIPFGVDVHLHFKVEGCSDDVLLTHRIRTFSLSPISLKRLQLFAKYMCYLSEFLLLQVYNILKDILKPKVYKLMIIYYYIL